MRLIILYSCIVCSLDKFTLSRIRIRVTGNKTDYMVR